MKDPATGLETMTRVLVVDNYDSFTWNLVHLIGPHVGAMEVVRNDEIAVSDALDGGFDAIILSPGPCTPREAGICLDLVRQGAGRVPIFGVCLGLQTIGQAMGGDVVRAPAPLHGKVSNIHHEGRGVFRGVPNPFQATRYHSLVVDRRTCPADLDVTAQTSDGLIMGMSHKTLPLHGVQFHPESIMTAEGGRMVANFFEDARAWRNACGAPLEHTH
jgi:anthranilate synthase component 2